MLSFQKSAINTQPTHAVLNRIRVAGQKQVFKMFTGQLCVICQYNHCSNLRFVFSLQNNKCSTIKCNLRQCDTFNVF